MWGVFKQSQLTANPIIILDDNLAQNYFMSNLSQILPWMGQTING
jgi:hypothetical protein